MTKQIYFGDVENDLFPWEQVPVEDQKSSMTELLVEHAWWSRPYIENNWASLVNEEGKVNISKVIIEDFKFRYDRYLNGK